MKSISEYTNDELLALGADDLRSLSTDDLFAYNQRLARMQDRLRDLRKEASQIHAEKLHRERAEAILRASGVDMKHVTVTVTLPQSE